MLSFREHLDILKKHASNKENCEKDVKFVANEFLHEALSNLGKKDCCLISDIRGIQVISTQNTCKSIHIDYIDHTNFFSFTLASMECEDKEYALQVLKAIKDILSEENFYIDHELPYSFDVSF